MQLFVVSLMFQAITQYCPYYMLSFLNYPTKLLVKKVYLCVSSILLFVQVCIFFFLKFLYVHMTNVEATFGCAISSYRGGLSLPSCAYMCVVCSIRLSTVNSLH